MSIKLPNLDIKTYQEISDEMIASIPKYTDKWTNHNPSDPGITIIELLSWIAETTLYRINRVPDESYVNFLRLVAGASSAQDVDHLLEIPGLDKSHRMILEFLKNIDKKPVEEMKGAALRFLMSHYRAVTEEDFRQLAIEATSDEIGKKTTSAKVKRAIVRKAESEEKIEIIIVSDIEESYNELIVRVKNYLDPRKLIGTKIEVKKPVYTDVSIDIKVKCHHYATPRKVEENIKANILEHLDPFVGGEEKSGWPYRRPLSVYEMAHVIEDTEGVKQTEYIKFDKKEQAIKVIDGLIKISSIDVEVEKEEK